MPLSIEFPSWNGRPLFIKIGTFWYFFAKKRYFYRILCCFFQFFWCFFSSFFHFSAKTEKSVIFHKFLEEQWFTVKTPRNRNFRLFSKTASGLLGAFYWKRLMNLPKKPPKNLRFWGVFGTFPCFQHFRCANNYDILVIFSMFFYQKCSVFNAFQHSIEFPSWNWGPFCQ